MEYVNALSSTYGLPILFCAIILIYSSISKASKILRSENPENISLIIIWLSGLISFLFGILGHILNMKEAFDAIAMADQISPSIVADGIRYSFHYSVLGLSVLILSLIIWGVLKGMINARS